MEYHEEHRSWSICRELRLFAVFERYSFLSKHPFAKKCSFSDLCIFLSASFHKISPNVSRNMLKIQSSIFIPPCRNDPSQLQNRKKKRFFTVFGTLLVTWRQRKGILSPAHPKTVCSHTPKQSVFCLFFDKFERFFRFDT